jgi:hypothetical protein
VAAEVPNGDSENETKREPRRFKIASLVGFLVLIAAVIYLVIWLHGWRIYPTQAVWADSRL